MLRVCKHDVYPKTEAILCQSHVGLTQRERASELTSLVNGICQGFIFKDDRILKQNPYRSSAIWGPLAAKALLFIGEDEHLRVRNRRKVAA